MNSVSGLRPGKFPQRFKKLKIWQRAIDFISEVYRITEEFPEREKYGLTSQIRRAALSIALNIAEGSASSTDKEFARYLNISLSSTYELICGFEISKKLKICSPEVFEKALIESDEIAAMLSGFIRTLYDGKTASCELQAASLK